MSTNWTALTSLLLTVSPGLAWGQTSAGGEDVEPTAPTLAPALDEAEPEKKKKKKKGADAGENEGIAVDAGPVALEFRGRVFAGGNYVDRVNRGNATLTGVGPEGSEESFTLGVQSARAGVKAHVHDWVTLALEIDFAPKADLKDAFIQGKRKHWLAKVGQFKMPISAFNLESPWSFPLARRGALHGLLADSLQIMGRRPGMLGQIRGGGDWDLALSLGIFSGLEFAADMRNQGVVDRSPVDEKTFVARLSATPRTHELALVGLIHGAKARPSVVGPMGIREVQISPTTGFAAAPEFTSLWTVGAEGTFDWQFATTGLRLWSEAFVGTQALDDLVDGQHAQYVAARALGAYRFGGMAKGQTYAETFVAAGGLDPDLRVVGDLAWETTAGFTIGHWRETRVTFQAEYGGIGSTLSREFFVSGKGVPSIAIPKKYLVLVLEVGAAF